MLEFNAVCEASPAVLTVSHSASAEGRMLAQLFGCVHLAVWCSAAVFGRVRSLTHHLLRVRGHQAAHREASTEHYQCGDQQ